MKVCPSLVVFGLLSTCIWAQDTRDVQEPVIPQTCSVLAAKLTSIDSQKTLDGADEERADTARIQKALDECGKGHAVQLKSDAGHDAFLTGPLELRAGVTLLVHKGAVLFGSRNPRDYDLAPDSCGIVVKESSPGCKPMIAGTNVEGAGVMGPGTIDGRGWAKLIGKEVTWWELAEQARKGGSQHCPRILVLSHANNFTLYKITLKNSPNFHVYYGNGDGFTAWGVIINTPKTARNTDGIDPGGSTNVTITNCFIHTGDDHVAIKAGAQGHVSHMTIAHNHFYTGHGLSIGSETFSGADSIRVTDLTIDGADNGLRIKSNSSRGGLVRDIVYSDVCIRNTRNPIFMDADYEHAGKTGTKLPVLRDIELHNVSIVGGGKLTLNGFDKDHRLGMLFDHVNFESSSKTEVIAEHADFKMTSGNFVPTGNDVQVIEHSEGKPASSCANRFVAMP